MPKLASEYQASDLLSGEDPLVTLYDYLVSPTGEAGQLTPEGKEMAWKANMARYLCSTGEPYEQFYDRYAEFLANWKSLASGVLEGFGPPTWMPAPTRDLYAELRVLGGCPVTPGSGEIGAYVFPRPSPYGGMIVGALGVTILGVGGWLLYRALSAAPARRSFRRRKSMR